ncbi:hypothetical protein [Chamaesiphon polymorphus]|uniref:PH domain-containing protein n=1 Tax=Chamaesiphon polymorphus CCALA 037 TaxID=2107692 RepID=A0A2T1GN18_9CYAN|nr:hypothetical protein [Chamaesiphon polymorphus]PSB59269.1 hypothetical protein C7B77_01490 [Chamaesiphon polymorphus CCALA 037]
MSTIFHISPLIRITLSLLYISLMIPLPFLATFARAEVPAWLMWVGIGLGFTALQGALSQRVVVDDRSIQVNYPAWVPSLFVKSWSLAWSDVKELKMRTTGQGGLVYYFINGNGEGFLLPMRVAGFNRLVGLIQQYTSIDTTDIYPLSQPWMYFALLLLTGLLLLTDTWTIWTAIDLSI